jgi:uncharacterized membrane protein
MQMNRDHLVQTAVFLGAVFVIFPAGTVFASSAPLEWMNDGWRLLGGTLALALYTFYSLAYLGGTRPALRFMASTIAISWLVEIIGLHTGWLFGGIYRYHPEVRPNLPGGVPLFIPFAWFVLSGIAVMLLRWLGTSHPAGARNAGRILLKSALSATALAICDLALDPVAVSVGLWEWKTPGPYFGVPFQNFSGWWAVGFVIFMAGYAVAGIDRAHGRHPALPHDSTWLFAHSLLLGLLGVAVVNRTGCVQPFLFAAAAMLPFSLAWLAWFFRQAPPASSVPRVASRLLAWDEQRDF